MTMEYPQDCKEINVRIAYSTAEKEGGRVRRVGRAPVILYLYFYLTK